ncbi:hypothetical protein TNCV_3456081 [Trichonephila clavipes]|nr:hypothetical protein TNCV_3456081 [Trichonephila clavipes]
MVAMTLGLLSSGFGFESRVRLGCIFFGKEVGLSPEMDSRLERKSSVTLLVICWDHRLTYLGILQRKMERKTRMRENQTQVKISSNYTRAFGDGPRNFEPWSSDVDDT